MPVCRRWAFRPPVDDRSWKKTAIDRASARLHRERPVQSPLTFENFVPLLRPNKEIFGGEYTRPSLVRLGHSMSSAPSRLELPLSFATTATSTSSPDREATRRRRRLPPPAPPNPQEEGITTAEAALTVAMSTGKRLAKRSILGTRVVAPGEDGRFYPAVIQVLSTVPLRKETFLF